MLVVLFVSMPNKISLRRLIAIDRYDLEIVHLGTQKERINDAKSSGVQSVPVLVIDNKPLHINFGASLSDLG